MGLMVGIGIGVVNAVFLTSSWASGGWFHFLNCRLILAPQASVWTEVGFCIKVLIKA